MLKAVRARHEAGMRLVHEFEGADLDVAAVQRARGEVVVTDPGEDPDALGHRWLATAGAPAGVAR